MARGLKDWTSALGPTEVTLRPSIYSSTGRALMVDDFEATTVKWFSGGSTGSSIAHSTAAAFNGNNSLLLTAGTSVAYTGIANRLFPPLEKKKLGIELVFNISSATKISFVYAWIQYTDNDHRTQFQWAWYPVTDLMYYRNSAGTIIEIPNWDYKLYAATTPWYRIKMIVDQDTSKYVSLQANDYRFDMSNLDGQKSTTAAASNVQVALGIAAIDNTQPKVYFDDVVVTEE